MLHESLGSPFSQAIADPRELSPALAESLVSEAVPVVFVSCNMHSTEIAAAEWSMTLAWDLGTSDAEVWKQVRDEVVTGLSFKITNSRDSLLHSFLSCLEKKTSSPAYTFSENPPHSRKKSRRQKRNVRITDKEGETANNTT